MTYLVKSYCVKINTINNFSSVFFLIYLGVKNLTGNFSLEEENNIQIDKEEIKSLTKILKKVRTVKLKWLKT